MVLGALVYITWYDTWIDTWELGNLKWDLWMWTENLGDELLDCSGPAGPLFILFYNAYIMPFTSF